MANDEPRMTAAAAGPGGGNPETGPAAAGDPADRWADGSEDGAAAPGDEPVDTEAAAEGEPEAPEAPESWEARPWTAAEPAARDPEADAVPGLASHAPEAEALSADAVPETELPYADAASEVPEAEGVYADAVPNAEALYAEGPGEDAPEADATPEPPEEPAPAPPSLVEFLERAEALPQAVRLRERSYSLLALAPEGLTLDVGCGTGRAVAEMEERGYPSAGIDVSERMIAVARERFPDIDVRIAPAEGLPFDDESVARYRAERVFQYIPAASIAMAEAFRVLKPGGRIALIDQDYDMLAIDADDEARTRVLLRALSASLPQPWAGRRYRNLLLDAGFTEVSVSVDMLTFNGTGAGAAGTGPGGPESLQAQVSPLLSSIAETGAATGVVSPEQASEWLAEQRRRAETGRFFAVLPVFVASATRPVK